MDVDERLTQNLNLTVFLEDLIKKIMINAWNKVLQKQMIMELMQLY